VNWAATLLKERRSLVNGARISCRGGGWCRRRNLLRSRTIWVPIFKVKKRLKVRQPLERLRVPLFRLI